MNYCVRIGNAPVSFVLEDHRLSFVVTEVHEEDVGKTITTEIGMCNGITHKGGTASVNEVLFDAAPL